MNKNFFPTKTQTNEISSYIRYKYPFINTLSYQNKNNKIIQKIHFHKLPFQLNNHYTKNINKKNFFEDEDDTKNNENFKVFMDSLLNKEDLNENIENEKLLISGNSNINCSNNFILKKINNNSIDNTINSTSKKEEDFYYSFHENKFLKKNNNKNNFKIKTDILHNKYKVKNFMLSLPKKNAKKLLSNINNKHILEVINNKGTELNDNNKNKNKDFDIDKNSNSNYISISNFLKSFQKNEKKNFGIDLKKERLYQDKDKDKDNKRKNLNTIKNTSITNCDDYLTKMTQTFSLKEFDGKMLNDLVKIDTTPKKNKDRKKNNSYNYLKRFIPDYKIPKIIFYSKNKDKKDKQRGQRLLEIKEKALLFLKDKSQNSLTLFNVADDKFNLNVSRNINFNSNYFLSGTNYSNINMPSKTNKKIEENVNPFFNSVDRYRINRTKRQTIHIDNKKKKFSPYKTEDNYNNINNINSISEKKMK